MCGKEHKIIESGSTVSTIDSIQNSSKRRELGERGELGQRGSLGSNDSPPKLS